VGAGPEMGGVSPLKRLASSFQERHCAAAICYLALPKNTPEIFDGPSRKERLTVSVHLDIYKYKSTMSVFIKVFCRFSTITIIQLRSI
jgi:hypothetical protein